MNWKTTNDIFKARIDRECYNRKQDVRRMTNAERMFELSLAQQEIGEMYHLYEVAGTLNLVAGQSTYAVGSTATTIPSNILLIKTAEINEDGKSTIEKVSKQVLNNETRIAGLPTKYTVYGTGDNRILEINSNPTYSYDATSYPEYRINYLYSGQLELFKGATGQFADYDETEADFGGEWLIPSSFHNCIIEIALGNIFPDLKASALQNAAMTYRMSQPKYVAKDFTYSLGGLD